MKLNPSEASESPFTIGQLVLFTDPDEGKASGWYTVQSICGEVHSLTNEAGSELEAFAHELQADRTHLLKAYYVELHEWLEHEQQHNDGIQGFNCEAEDAHHAKEQAENAYPEAKILFVQRMDGTIELDLRS